MNSNNSTNHTYGGGNGASGQTTNGNLSTTNHNNFGSTNGGVNLGASMHSQNELSPRAYTNKYQDQVIRKIANSS